MKIPVRKVFSSGKYLLRCHLLEPTLTCIYHLCSSKRLSPPALKKLSFHPSPVKDFHFILDDHRSFSTRETSGLNLCSEVCRSIYDYLKYDTGSLEMWR